VIAVIGILLVMLVSADVLYSMKGISMTKFLVALTILLLLGIGLIAKQETPQSGVMTLDKDCVVYLPHADYQQEGDFNQWMATLKPFTNLDYSHGEWLADGKVVAYGDAEDSAITNGKCGQ
jgi:hypothetical protein